MPQVALVDALTEPLKLTKASGVAARSLEVLPADVEGKLLTLGVLFTLKSTLRAC